MIIAGCGYTGVRLARRASSRNEPVLGIVSRESRRERLAQRGIDALAADLDGDQALPSLPSARAVVYLVPPPNDGDKDPRLARFLARLTRPTRLIYASTTGVYGDHDGNDVDEETPVNPQSPRALRRAAAESTVRDWCRDHDVPWVVLRIPGIYGPHRLQQATLSAGKPLPRLQDASPGNRIHVDDLAHTLHAACSTPHANQVFNVGDGDYRSNTEFVMAVADALNGPRPPLVTMDELKRSADPSRWSFLRESRRVATHRMRTLLGVTPRYRRFEDGIRASLVQQSEEL